MKKTMEQKAACLAGLNYSFNFDILFHFKEQPIKLHRLICFMTPVVSKHIELKTDVSIRKFIDESKKIVDSEILNHITQKIVTVKAQPTPKMMELIAKLETPHPKGASQWL